MKNTGKQNDRKNKEQMESGAERKKKKDVGRKLESVHWSIGIEQNLGKSHFSMFIFLLYENHTYSKVV